MWYYYFKEISSDKFADDILLEGYGKTLVNISPDGTVKITKLKGGNLYER